MSRGHDAALTDEQWSALRAAWEAGTPNRALAAQYGVDESSIRYRAKKGAWQRDEAALERMQAQGQARTLLGAANPASPHGFPHPAPRGIARESLLTDEDRARLREEHVEAAADVIAAANLAALAKVTRLDATFERLTSLLADALTTPADDDEAGRKRRAEALNVLLAGRSDSITSTIMAQAKLAESIQNQRRKALGADDRPKQVQLTGAGGGPIQTENHTATTVVDYSRYTTAELEELMRAAAIIEGRQERPPVPMPPGDPLPVGDQSAAETQSIVDNTP